MKLYQKKENIIYKYKYLLKNKIFELFKLFTNCLPHKKKDSVMMSI